MVRKQLRNANRGEVPLKRPKSKKDVGERTYVRSLTPQPLRSSGEDEEQNSVQQMAGKRVSGRRIATDVVERTRRRNTTLAWQDRPPEVWNATHLTGYFDAQTFTHLHGRSANRFKMKPLLAHFARMRREGIDSVTCKEMIDLFVQQQLAQPDGTVVASYWQLFVSQSGTLRNLLTTTAGQHYNNQPTSDDEGEWT